MENNSNKETYKYIYVVQDKYEKDIIITLLLFKKKLDYQDIKEIQNNIDKIKEELDDWQYDDILDKLHEIYDFEEQEVQYKNFEI